MSRKGGAPALTWLGVRPAAAYLAERLPQGAAPAAATLQTWCKPSWRQRHPHSDMPPVRKIGRVWAWSTSDLDAWIARRINGGGR